MAKKTTPASSILSSLEFAIRATIEPPKTDDEFTVQDFILENDARGCRLSYTAATNLLRTLISSGKLESRKALYLGKRTNLYRLSATT